MKLYDRNYFSLTTEEQELIKKVRERNTTSLGEIKIYNSSMFREFPKASRHYESLFPNNYLDVIDLDDKSTLKAKNLDFKKVVEDDTSIESDIKSYIMCNQAYHIVGALLKEYHFGHHSAYMFPEFQLGNSFQADYLLVGDASGGHSFLFIEFENPYSKITISDGEFGETIRKGINQINDWKGWIEANYNSLYETFKKETSKQMPEEFFKLDRTRLYYAVIAGRRSDFTDKTYRLKRQLMADQKINLLHYDNVYDKAQAIIGEVTY